GREPTPAGQRRRPAAVEQLRPDGDGPPRCRPGRGAGTDRDGGLITAAGSTPARAARPPTGPTAGTAPPRGRASTPAPGPTARATPPARTAPPRAAPTRPRSTRACGCPPRHAGGAPATPSPRRAASA